MYALECLHLHYILQELVYVHGDLGVESMLLLLSLWLGARAHVGGWHECMATRAEWECGSLYMKDTCMSVIKMGSHVEVRL